MELWEPGSALAFGGMNGVNENATLSYEEYGLPFSLIPRSGGPDINDMRDFQLRLRYTKLSRARFSPFYGRATWINVARYVAGT